jgi:hypothetical protein
MTAAMTDFEKLFAALARRGGSRAAFLYAFDLIEVEGDDMRAQTWEVRRATLTKLLRKAAPGIRLSEHVGGCGDTIFAQRSGYALHDLRSSGVGLTDEGGADALSVSKWDQQVTPRAHLRTARPA